MSDNVHTISFMKGMDDLVEYIHKYNVNHAVVTNASAYTVNIYKTVLPSLCKLKNWLTRENYISRKPDGECYKLASKLFGRNEPYIVGLENTINGFNSLRSITKCIYILTTSQNYNYPFFLSQDAYLIQEYSFNKK